jgi:hypothetical protein
MALPTVYAKAEVRYGTTEQARQENVLWFVPSVDVAVADGATTAAALALVISTAVAGAIIPVLATDASYEATKVSLNTHGVTFEAESVFGAGNGSADGATSPENVAVLIKKQSSHGGKTGRGRWYIGCVPEVNTDIGQVNSGVYADYNALAAIYNTTFVTGAVSWVPNIMSRKDASMYPIFAVTLEVYTKSMRRRLVRPF